MGIDLTLVPIRYPELTWWLATDRISVDRHYALFAQIDKQFRDKFRGTEKVKTVVKKPRIIPENIRFSWFEDEGIKERRDDPYGTALTYVIAEDLAKVDASESSDWNKAVFAMVRLLPKETPVVLWWS